jgi:acyl-coenzyme A thioesterase PaaI-like protein
MVVTDAMVGAPARLHGGIMMAFFDEALGLICMHLGAEAMTASLTVDLRAPTYVGATLHQRAWVERRDGRKWFMRGEVHEAIGSSPRHVGSGSSRAHADQGARSSPRPTYPS